MKYITKEIKSKSDYNLIIREATIEDADNIKHCKEITSSELINQLNKKDDSYKLTIEEEDVIKECIVGENGIILIAEHQNQIIGFVSILVTSEKESQHIGVLGIVLIEKYRGEGVGSILIREVLHWAKNNSPLKKIILTVDVDNKHAIKLYEKYGFKEEGVINSEVVLEENAVKQSLMSIDI